MVNDTSKKDKKGNREPMRDLDVILDDMERFITDPSIDFDPLATAKFRKLHVELLEAKGCTLTETRCPVCNDILDNKDTEESRNWEFRCKDGKGQIVFFCERCKIEVPMAVKDPSDTARMN